jgi:nitric oxide reductase NorD protein
MAGLTHLFEPEELIGGFWHRLVADIGCETHHPDAAISLDHISKRLAIFFRALGGKHGVEIKPIGAQSTPYRKKFLAAITHGSTLVTRAKFDGDTLFLPEIIDIFPTPADNENLYKWLTIWASCVGEDMPAPHTDPLQNDIEYIRFCHHISTDILAQYPGMRSVYDTLLGSLLSGRPPRPLPDQEAEIEAVILAFLRQETPTGAVGQAVLDPEGSLDGFKADKGYKTFLPLAVWGEITRPQLAKPGHKQAPDPDTAEGEESGNEKALKAKRQKSDQVEKESSLLLNRFETILSWSEMMNIPRAVDDDDEDNAKQAANDQDEIGIVNIAKKAATKLKFDLDLAPEDVEHERLSDTHTYPEWDYRKNIYYPDHCRVLAGPAPELEEGKTWQPDKDARRRILAVKKQFEALRPKRERLHRQIDGNEIDIDALIRSRCDFLANGIGSNHVFTNTRESARDLSVSVLIDTSRSSESWIEGKQVIEISREALMALALGIAACGDDNAIYSFSSLKRDRVTVSTIKKFDEPLSPHVFSRIGALRPGFYTRLGAAIRHVSKELSHTQSTKRLLLVLTDGKPNDLDHYEGRYGVEDTARAVREARRMGHSVFGITIDKKAQSYFPYIFGRNAFAITNHANDLTKALPIMYRQLVT